MAVATADELKLSQVSINSCGTKGESTEDYPAAPSSMALLKTGFLTDCKLRLSIGDGIFSDSFDLHRSVICPFSRFCWARIYEWCKICEAENSNGLLITVPPLPDPHVTEQDVLKCTRIVLAFMYSYGDWEGLINGEALLSFGPRGSRRLCEALMCIFGLSQLLDIEKLSKLLSEHMTRLCREEPRNCALVLLRANFYSSCEARELCDEAEVVLKTNFEGCLFGSQPPRLLEFTQLPTSLISRILQENDLRKHPSPRGEWIVLKTCSNVLRQKQWDRPELVMSVQVVENPTALSSLENVTTTIRSLEGVLSDSEVVEGVAAARYETPPSSTDSTFAVVLPAPEDGMRVWVEIEWNGVNSEGRSITFTETMPANADVGVSSAFPVDISLESGALVRLVSVEKEIDQSPSSIRGCREVDSCGEVSMFEALYACVGWSSLSLKELQSAVESPLWRAAQPRVLAHMRRLIADQEHTAASVAKSDVAVQADSVDETRSKSKRKVDEAQMSGGSTSSSYKKARFFYAAAHGKRLRATKASPISFLHTRDFGAFGTLAWLGSRAQTEWKNPFSDLAEIRATTSGTANYRDLAGAIGREKRFFEADEYFRLDEGHPSWIQIDLGEERELKITGYCLRSSIAAGEFLMNWYMFGSVNGELWDVLDKHSNCKELLGDGRTGYFPVDGVEGGYRYFRLMQFGKNSSGTDVLTCAGIDFYGEAISGLW